MGVRDRLERAARIAAGAGLAVVLAAAIAVQAVAVATSWGGAYWVFGLAAGLVVGAITLARRRHLAGMSIAGLAVAAAALTIAHVAGLPAEPGPAMTLALAVLVGSTVRALPVPWAVGIAAAGLAVVGGAWFSGGFTTVAALNTAGWLAAVTVGSYLRLLDVRRRATAEAVRRDERLQLARELHDIVAHHITGIVLQSQAAQLVARKDPEKLDNALAGIEAAGSDALTAMRRFVGLLRDDGAPGVSGSGRLAELVQRFDGRGFEVRLDAPADEQTWPPEVTRTVYRVVQEALTNAARHAPQARSVTVNVGEDGNAVTVEIVDDAPPGASRRHHRSGYGLIGMRERVEKLGGTVHAGPRAGSGWSVTASLPLSARDTR